MKKALSGVLAASLAMSSFASVAFAADAPKTAQEMFDALKTKGIFEGYEDGSAGLDKSMTRAEVTKVLVKLLGLTEDKAAASVYTDLNGAGWAEGFIGAATKAGIMDGVADGSFDPSGKFTTEQLAAVLVRALKLPLSTEAAEGVVADWAKAYVATAVKAGLVAKTADYTTPALREVLVSSAFVADVKIQEAIEAANKLGVVTATQTGAKVVTVNFNKAVTDAQKTDLTYELKNGLVKYSVTPKYADDNKSVTLTATFLPAGEYTLTVKGIDPVTVKVEEEKVAKLQINATAMQKAANQEIKAVALNQFNEEVKNTLGDANISVFSSELGAKTVTGGKVDLSAEKIDNSIIVTVTHAATGLSATKTFKVVAESSATSIQLGQVAPLKDKTRISVSETGFVLPYTLADQYGASIKLPARAAAAPVVSEVVIGDIKFAVSDSAIINANTFTVDADGVLKFNTGATAGTAVITAYNTKTGAAHSTTVKVEAAAALKTFQVSNPGTIVVNGEDVVFPYVAADSYGAAMEKKDVPAAAAALIALNANNFRVESSNPAVSVAYTWKANGDLSLKFTGTGTTTLYVWVNGAIASQLNLDVKAPAYPVSITGTKDLKTTMAVNGTQTLGFDKLVVVDNYGRTMSANANGWAIAYAQEGAANTTAIELAGATVTGQVADSTEKVTVTLTKAGSTSVTYDIVFTTVANDKVKTFTLDAIGTLRDAAYADYTAANTAGYTKAIVLNGKTAEGVDVAIAAADFFDRVTTSNPLVVGVQSNTALNIYGVDAGKATVAVWKSGAKLAEQEVTVSDAAPVATSVKFTETEVTFSAATYDAAAKVEVKDQYGVALAKAGAYYSSNTAAATVDANGLVTKVARGITTITFVHNNGVSATLTVNVE